MNSVKALLNKFAQKATVIGENVRVKRERSLNNCLPSRPIQYYAIPAFPTATKLSIRGFLHYHIHLNHLAEERYTHV